MASQATPWSDIKPSPRLSAALERWMARWGSSLTLLVRAAVTETDLDNIDGPEVLDAGGRGVGGE